MTEPAWLLLTFGPLLWMALLAALLGSGEKSDPAWVRAWCCTQRRSASM